MRLLFDENLSPKLSQLLAQEYQGSVQVCEIGLRGATDEQIWDYARAHDLAIVSKDTDFRERSFVESFPPKVIWLDVGTAGTLTIASLLRRERHRIETFGQDQKAAFLHLLLQTNAR